MPNSVIAGKRESGTAVSRIRLSVSGSLTSRATHASTIELFAQQIQEQKQKDKYRLVVIDGFKVDEEIIHNLKLQDMAGFGQNCIPC
jgi:pantothenate kinase